MWDGSVGAGTELVVEGPIASEGAYLGCSIAVNGVCLTATELACGGDPSQFRVGLAPETLRRTNLGALKPGDAVQLCVDYGRRAPIAQNHTTTHMLNYALRAALEQVCETHTHTHTLIHTLTHADTAHHAHRALHLKTPSGLLPF